MNAGKLLRIGVFYDGQLFFNISNYYNYEHDRKSRISIGGLQQFIRRKISSYYSHDFNMCQIVDAHYFRGRHSAQMAEERRQLLGERIFDDILMNENIVTHYWSLRMTSNGGFEEKGIDVWLALEAYELAVLRKCDVVVLVVMDGDYLPLVRKIQALGIQVVLLYWEYEYQNKFGEQKETRVSNKLLRAVSYAISVSDEISSNKDDNLVNQLFVKNSEEPIKEQPLDDIMEESVIFSIKGGYGFIKDESVGNIFFHYTSLENCGIDDLEVDMRVRYIKVPVDNPIGSGHGHRYTAKHVWVLDIED
jgi:uncharacterized LabA/DUF88 family protein/cold shock CspA family protein